jgi:hypothetical protein
MSLGRVDVAPPPLVLVQYVTTDGSTTASFGYLTPNGGWVPFVAAICGVGCPTASMEESIALQNWSALQVAGDLGWLGANYNGVTVDPSSMLAAARVAGVTQLDTWLNSGTTGDATEDALIADAILRGTGYDVSNITGNLNPGSSGSATPPTNYAATDSNAGSDRLAQLAGVTASTGGAGISWISGGGTPICNSSVASAQNAQAQSYVNNMLTIAQGASGISTLSGNPVSAGGASGAGMFNSGCLSTLMSGSRDLLFKPPGLGSLLSSMASMFGGGGSGGSSGSSGCNNAPSPQTQVAQSNPTGIFYAIGGFFPGHGYAGNESTVANNTLVPDSSSKQVQGGLAGMYSVTSR